MVVHRNRQPVTPTQAAALENHSPIFCGHALSKTVDTESAMNFGLISPLWHYTFLSST
jgi:hypothetical protein